jgi:hypothetical protein
MGQNDGILSPHIQRRVNDGICILHEVIERKKLSKVNQNSPIFRRENDYLPFNYFKNRHYFIIFSFYLLSNLCERKRKID